MCLICLQDATLLDWGISRRQMLGVGSAFIAAATFGSVTADAQIARPSRSSGPPQRGPHNVVFSNVHVIDPESGLSDVRNVGVTGDKITKVSADALTGDEVIDAKGLVLAPGFVDVHCHAPVTPSMRLAALDGVTTALELELGGLPIPLAYSQTEAEGRPINFGYSASWAMARQKVMDGVQLDGRSLSYFSNFGKPRWKESATAGELRQILDVVEEALKDGAIGIGLMLGYAPNTGPSEYIEVARLAKRYGVATFTHARSGNAKGPITALDSLKEIIAASGETGAHMHVCHVHSTATRLLPQAMALLRQAKQAGVHVTAEANPWGAQSTSIGAAFFTPSNLDKLGLKPTDILYVKTRQRLTSLDQFEELRKRDPAGLGVFFSLDEDKPEDREILDLAVLAPETAIATDRLPFFLNGKLVHEDLWPLPEGAYAHPRGVGTFARILGRYVRERKQLTLEDAIRKSSLIPAQLIEDSAPTMRNKGRIKEGADADIVVFDPKTVIDRATYDNPLQPSIGMKHVLVNGIFIVKEGEMQLGSLPGRPIRAARRA